MGEGIIGIEREGAAKFLLTAHPIKFVEEFVNGERGVGLGGVVVQWMAFSAAALALGLACEEVRFPSL